VRVEDVLGIATWGELTFDPVRPRLYFSETVPDKRKNRMCQRIMMMDASGHNPPVALTMGSSDHQPVPSPDGRWLGFLARRSGSQQVWRLPLDGGEAEQVTFIQGGVKDFVWAPNSEALVVVAHIHQGLLEKEMETSEPTADASDTQWEQHYTRDVKHIVHQYYKLDGTGFFDQGRDQLVWVDTDSSHLSLMTSGFDHFSGPVFSPDGAFLYFLHRPYDPERGHPGVVMVEQLALATRQRVTLAIPEWSIGGLAVSPDGKFLAFSATDPADHGYGLSILYQYELATGQIVDLSSVTDRPVGDESGTDVPSASGARPVWNNENVLMLLSDEGRVMLTQFSHSGVIRLWDKKRVVYDFAVQGTLFALAISDPVHPSGIIVKSINDNAEEVHWAPVPWAGSEGPMAPEEIWAAESDGTRVHTWCLKPKEGLAPYPTVLEIHGGPMSMYGYRYHHEFQCLVAAGYAVVYTNPRGSQGYGRDFCRAIVGRWGDKDYRDVMAGLDGALKEWPDLSSKHLGVAGGSYGGFMVNWIVGHSERFEAAVTMRSVVNRFSAMGSSDLGWLRVPQYGTKPWWEEPERYWQQSPLRYASRIHTPILIEHQEKDFRLPVEQGEQLYSALKYLGRTVEMVLYPDESHGMSRTGQPWHRVHRLRTIIGWFNRYMRS